MSSLGRFVAAPRSPEERLILEAQTTLALADIATLAEVTADGDPKGQRALGKLLRRLRAPLAELSEALSNSHFSHSEKPRQLIEMI